MNGDEKLTSTRVSLASYTCIRVSTIAPTPHDNCKRYLHTPRGIQSEWRSATSCTSHQSSLGIRRSASLPALRPGNVQLSTLAVVEEFVMLEQAA